jgi:hypothetical protein
MLILTQFLGEFIQEKNHGCFVKERAMFHTGNFLVSAPGEVFGEWLITRGLWLPRNADLN